MSEATPTNLMSRWSVRWSWRLRVEEWDQDQETIKAVALNSSIALVCPLVMAVAGNHQGGRS